MKEMSDLICGKAVVGGNNNLMRDSQEKIMVHDKLENLLHYIPEKKKVKIEQFISKISPDMKEGIYEIDGEDIYARIMSYNTKFEENCDLEAHDIYMDIQFSLLGEEGISVYPREQLHCISVDSENDFNLFDGKDISPQIRICNRVGWFTLLKTVEAHRPQESVDGKCNVVKKGVIKIKETCYE